MKKFVISVIILPTILVLGFLLMLNTIPGETTDEYYNRLSNGQAGSMIIGTSRAGQGLNPDVFERSNLTFARPILNFAFTGSHSPFGPAYLNAIKKKLLPSEIEDGIFILEINPTSVLLKEGGFVEEESFIAKLNDFSSDPNFDYLINSYSYPYYTLLKNKFSETPMNLHKNGWLTYEVSIDSASEIEKAIALKFDLYARRFSEYNEISEIRWNYLDSTVNYLSEYGDVYLVRLPINPRILKLEDSTFTNFDRKIALLAEKTGVTYINLIGLSDSVRTIDGGHLYFEDASHVSKVLLENILADKKKEPCAGSRFFRVE